MREPYPSETQDRFMVRLPDGMRDKIKAAAQASKRNMNGEIIARLEATFEAERQGNPSGAAGVSPSGVLGAPAEIGFEARVKALEVTVMALIANVSELSDKLDRSDQS